LEDQRTGKRCRISGRQTYDFAIEDGQVGPEKARAPNALTLRFFEHTKSRVAISHEGSCLTASRAMETATSSNLAWKMYRVFHDDLY